LPFFSLYFRQDVNINDKTEIKKIFNEKKVIMSSLVLFKLNLINKYINIVEKKYEIKVIKVFVHRPIINHGNVPKKNKIWGDILSSSRFVDVIKNTE
tara:strand:- start:195 stop:485 length:291 start_codon:yes stop_codon:yes gene_type:complete